jgi:hypothetical protein
MRRPYLLLLIGLAIVVFVAVSALLARAFSAEGAERSALTALVRSEARGDVAGTIGQITGCAQNSACRDRVNGYVAKLHAPGNVSILRIQVSAGFSLTSTLGIARVAFTVGASRPIVECVQVRRAGNVISQLHIELLAVKLIKSDADCPARL